MAPPKWLVDYWKEETNWIKRFIRGSFELNIRLCSSEKLDDKDTMWKPPAIREFLKYANKVVEKSKEITLYRGTTVPSPTMSHFDFELKNCQFMSTTKSLAIAKEFAYKGGYIHVLHLKKGVSIYDIKDLYSNDGVKREKEVIIYPGCTLKLLAFSKNTFHWEVSN